MNIEEKSKTVVRLPDVSEDDLLVYVSSDEVIVHDASGQELSRHKEGIFSKLWAKIKFWGE